MSTSEKPVLRLDWCSHEAAKYAVEKWHYSGRLSKARNVYLGVWERSAFIGVVVFGIGSGNVTNGHRYGLARTSQVAELTRVALRSHNAPVSRIVAIALRMLKRQSPGIRLVVSMADPAQGHVGAIYQAGGWLYTGQTKPDVEYFCNGQWVHHRTATSRRSAAGLPSRPVPPKHRYLMPLDAVMRAQLTPLAKPYPKRLPGRPRLESEAPGTPVGHEGAAMRPGGSIAWQTIGTFGP
jgi:hypothetical protein